MLCDICGKSQATVHLTEIINNQMTELHLCEKCARQKGMEMEQNFGLADLLSGLSDLNMKLDVETKTVEKCPNCGMKYNDFRKIGRLGCSECYTTFRKYLLPLLKRIHSSTKHTGGRPIKLTKPIKTKYKAQDEISILKEKLHKAIQEENFEEAAKLRDKMRELERKRR